MKVFFFTLVATITIVAVTANRPTYTLTTQWSTLTLFDGVGSSITAKNDLLIYSDISNPDTPVIAIRRRNADGVYVPVANVTEAVTNSICTNGKWISLPDGVSDNVVLFTIDENNNVSNTSNLSSHGGFLLSDDTFVGYDPISPNDDGNYTIRTHQHEASNNTWNDIPGTELVVRTGVAFLGDASTYRATDTHLVFLDMSDSSNFTVNIYERQADRSWKFVDLVPVNSTEDELSGSVNFNGETLVFARYLAELAPDTYGEVYVYTKTNNGWTEQTFNLLELGYRPLGILGYRVIFVDADTMLFSVAFDGYTNNVTTPGGKVLSLTRENGVWKDSLDFVGDTGVFGAGLAINDHDVIAAAITSVLKPDQVEVRFFTAPLSVTGITRPVAAPVTNVTPVAPVTPVQATPSKVSSAVAIQLGPVSFSVVIALVLYSL